MTKDHKKDIRYQSLSLVDAKTNMKKTVPLVLLKLALNCACHARKFSSTLTHQVIVITCNIYWVLDINRILIFLIFNA